MSHRRLPQYDTIRDSFTAQAEARVAKDSGQDAAAIFEWAWSAVPDLMSKAVNGHLRERTTNGYTKVVDAYYEALPTTDPTGLMAALKANGFTKVTQTRDGKILFSSEDGEMEWKAALAAGLVKPGGGRRR